MNSLIKYLFLGLILGTVGLAGCATVDRETASADEDKSSVKPVSLMDRSGY
jgi:hypothetical protein